MYKKRSAESPLRGFYYQFDTTIRKILQQEDCKLPVTIEGVEDIDIETADSTTCMQIKYHEASNGTESLLRKPIQLMLQHYKNNITCNYRYILHGHYKDNNSINIKFDIDRIKNMMQCTEKGISKDFIQEYGLSDVEISTFIEKFKFTLGNSFAENQSKTLKLIKTNFNINDDTEADFFYNNSLRIIWDLSIKKDIKNRKITKNTFISKCRDSEHILFSSWYIKLKGFTSYYKWIFNQYFCKLNTLNIHRIFILNSKNLDLDGTIKAIYSLEEKFYKAPPNSAKTNGNPYFLAPYFFINNSSRKFLVDLKNRIMGDNKNLHDGYCFKDDTTFRIKEIMQCSSINNKITIKILNSQSDLKELIQSIDTTKEVYQFYHNNSKPISIDSIKIQIHDISQINQMIRK